MKRYSLAFFLIGLIGFISCTRINESTTVGGGLIPGVDNVHTFEVYFDPVTSTHTMTDSTRVRSNDLVTVGILNDAVFGNSDPSFSFKIVPSVLGSYPYVNKDSLHIDSVVVSLSYAGAYGDTATGSQTLEVFEIKPGAGFSEDSLYKFSDPASDFANSPFLDPIGTSLPFQIKNKIKDTFTITRPKDTTKVVGVVRIKLNDTSIGHRFAQYDTSSTSANGGYNARLGDSIFLTLFKGLAVRAKSTSSNVLTYYNLSDLSKTKLTVYFYAIKNGDTVWGAVDYSHVVNGQANYIGQPTVFPNPSDQVLIQSASPGTYGAVYFKQLDTFSNKVIHRAELIVSRIPSINDMIFTAPPVLILDRISKGNPDTAFLLYNDLPIVSINPINIKGTTFYEADANYEAFGGILRYDNTYRFNISRHVQGIITRDEPNDTLRLYAPLRTTLYDPLAAITTTTPGGFLVMAPGAPIGYGRAVLAGGSFAEPAKRMRLHIIYSKL